MRIKRRPFEIIIAILALLVLAALSKVSPTAAVSSAARYIPPDVIDPKQLLHYPDVQERTEIVQSKRERRGFGMGFQMRSNFWLDNEEISLVELTANYSDTFVTLEGKGTPETKLQVVEVLSWGGTPIVSIGASGNTDVGYAAGYGSGGYLIVYPLVDSDARLRSYCDFYRRRIFGRYFERKFAPVLSYEYFSGRLDGVSRWDVIDESCFDFLALSSYPSRIYRSIEDLPKNYYQDVVDKFPGKDILFADVGWSTTVSSEEDQSLFLEYLYSFAKNNPTVKGLIYGHLFDPFGNELYYYQGTGLIAKDGVEKPALKAWKKLFSLSGEK